MKLKKDSLSQMVVEIVNETKQFYIDNQILYTQNIEDSVRYAVHETYFRTKNIIQLKSSQQQIKLF